MLEEAALAQGFQIGGRLAVRRFGVTLQEAAGQVERQGEISQLGGDGQ